MPMLALISRWSPLLLLLSQQALAAPVLRLKVEAQPGLVERLLDQRACPGCDLRGTVLREVHLIGADLRRANLADADLSGANLEGADLSHANLAGADLQGANLTNADLTGVDLRGADLRTAVVINAFAPDVRTDGIRYAGADLTGSDLIIGGGD